MSTWQIGESGTEVKLAGKPLSGQISYTVTNGGTTQDRSVLTITPLDGAADTWFAVEEPQKVVPLGASVTYLCTVTIPEGTAPGNYGMQGVVYSADRDPGETAVTSKRSAIVVPEEKDEGGGIPWWVFAIAAAIGLIAIVVIALIVFGGDDEGGDFENIEPPTIEGTPEVLQTLTADEGRWSEEDENIVRFSFQWQRCAEGADAEDCVDIDGAVIPVYQVAADDVGQRLQVEVTLAPVGDEEPASTATTAATVPPSTAPVEGAVSATSEPTEVVAPTAAPPAPVPNVVGFGRNEAAAQLTNFQVVVLVAGDPVASCNPIVESQDPNPPTVLAAGEKVTIVTRPLLDPIGCLPIFIGPLLIDDQFIGGFTADEVQDLGEQMGL